MQLKKALIVDTNVILRFLLCDIPELYQKAVDIFQLVENGKLTILLSDLVFSECVWVLEKFYRVPKKEISQKLSVFLHPSGVLTETPKPVLEKALIIWGETSFDWTDAFLIAKAEYGKTKLITFDQEIKRKFPQLVEL